MQEFLSQADAPPVTVIVLNWRGIAKTRECLTALRQDTYPNRHLLVVDNGTETPEGDQLKEEFPEIELVKLDQNYGFAGGCNKGMAHAKARNPAYIWLLNNNAIPEPHTLTRLVQAMMRDPQAGAAAALVVEGPGSQHKKADLKPSGIGQIDYGKAKTYLRQCKPYENIEGLPCDWITGSNLLLSKEAIAKVGGFDENFFLYFEDVDICVQIRKAGFKCLLVTESIVAHEGSAATQGSYSLWRSYYHTRNRFIFFAKNSPPHLKPLAFLMILSHVLRHCITFPGRGKFSQYKLKAELLGLSDFVQGKLGKAKCLEWCDKIK